MRLVGLASCLAFFGWFRSAGPEQYFTHWHVDAAQVAPDGRHVAYLEEAGTAHLEVVVVECDRPEQRATYRLPLHSPLPSSSLGALTWMDNRQIQVDLPDRSHWRVGASKLPTAVAQSLPAAAPEPSDSALSAKFPGRTVTVTSWDQPRQRAVLWVHSASEAGRYFLYDRPADRLTEFAGRLPLLHWADLAEVSTFEIPGARPRLAVYSSPRNTGERSLPLMVLCREAALSSTSLEYEPFAQALCSAGYAVLEVGALPGESAAETLRAQVRGVELAAARWPLDATEVTTFGVGGDEALRLARQYPQRFRSGVAIGVGSFGSDPEEGDRYYSVPTRLGQGPEAVTTALDFLRHKP